MKKACRTCKGTMRSILLLAAFSLCLSACNKDNSCAPLAASAPASVSNGTITAEVNGAAWRSVKNSAMLSMGRGIYGFVINAESASELVAISIDIPTTDNFISTGSHAFKGQVDDLLITYSTRNKSGRLTTQHLPEQATLSISSVDKVNKKVSGTFSFVSAKSNAQSSADTVRVTNGVFTDLNFVVVNQYN